MFNPDTELRLARERHADMLKYVNRQQLYQQLRQRQSQRLAQPGHRLNSTVQPGKAQAGTNLRVAVVSKWWLQIKNLAMKLFWIDQNAVPAYPQGYLLRRDNHETH